MSSEDEEDFLDDGLEVDAEHGCYWFVISLVYLNMVNFVHLNSKVFRGGSRLLQEEGF